MFKTQKFNVNSWISVMKSLALLQKYQSQNCMEARFYCWAKKKYKPRYNSQFQFYISLYVHITQLRGGKSPKNYQIKSQLPYL